jgi:hypothetical protein
VKVTTWGCEDTRTYICLRNGWVLRHQEIAVRSHGILDNLYSTENLSSILTSRHGLRPYNCWLSTTNLDSKNLKHTTHFYIKSSLESPRKQNAASSSGSSGSNLDPRTGYLDCILANPSMQMQLCYLRLRNLAFLSHSFELNTRKASFCSIIICA